jgi:diguanylate cyclase (GGDEF)-like protein/PAS domain S-box-containing protein
MPHRFLASVLPQHEAAELYRLMVVGIRKVAVFLMDPDGRITVWNQGAQNMKGYTADEAIGSHLGMLYTDEDRDAGHPAHNLRTAAQSGFFEEETWRKRKDGSLFWAHVALTALRDEHNTLLGFSKVTMDLTRHKLLEQCTREKCEIDMILQAADSGTWKWTIGRDQVAVSSHLLHMLGYEGGHTILSFSQWLDFVHRDDRPRFRSMLEQASRAPGGEPVETELRIRGQDRSYRWFFMRATWQQVDGPDSRVFMGVCVDIDTLKRAEQDKARLITELEQERTRFSNILDQLPTGVILADTPSGRVLYQNRAAAAVLDASVHDIQSYRDYERFHFLTPGGERLAPEDLPLTKVVRRQAARCTRDLMVQHDNGRRVHLGLSSSAIVDHDGIARLAVAVLHDVSELKQAELAGATEKERALVTLAALTDGVITCDRHGHVTSLNPAAERMTGVRHGDAVGATLRDLLEFEEEGGSAAFGDVVERCLRERLALTSLPHLTLLGRGGGHFSVDGAVAPIILGDGELIGAVLILHDVTESKRLLRRLGFEASHDALTGLVNRREFEVRLTRALDRARQPGSDTSALLYLDLDQFKVVNDTCGHSAGDELLKLLANSYSEHVRERDTLARIGGDEFALIIEHCHLNEVMAVAQKILDATRNFRYTCKGRVFQLGVSIGVTPIDLSTDSVEEAMRRADHACYMAKERGRNRIYVHHLGDLDFAQRRSDMHWVTRLTHAFQNEQMQLYYQPIMSLDNKKEDMQRYEILLRLRNGRAGPVSPGSFLPAAERYDVILKIDRWVLTRTLEWLSAHKAHTAALEMCSINLSRRSLADPSFHKFAAELIDASDVPADKLCFEITEQGAIADMQKTIAFIEALSARGCRFSLDDFGTGMTSFSYLKQLPVDFIKIDGAFIQMMSSSEVDFEMVRFTNDISHKMGRKTIAEYVSDHAILDSLRGIGVDFAQGYCIGKPRPLAERAA